MRKLELRERRSGGVYSAVTNVNSEEMAGVTGWIAIATTGAAGACEGPESAFTKLCNVGDGQVTGALVWWQH